MSSTPAYASTPLRGSALLGAAETSLTVPTTFSAIVTAGTAGSKIEAIQITSVATTVLGLVYMFIYDGTTNHLYDAFTIPVTNVSSTLVPYTFTKTYDNLILQPSDVLRASQSIVGNASLLKFHAFGGSF